MKKPSVAKGTRDFLPLQARRRKYIFDTIAGWFQLYGYQILETPAMENLETLTGKYGEEGDKLLFKILNSGDFLKSAEQSVLGDKNAQKLIPQIAEKGLRYDLTVPFARVVAMNQHAISFPFKRYQIQPVWRADRPQRGRYREFYQCDADVVGSDSLLYEAELLQLYDRVFKDFGIPVKIHINHRKILEGIAQQLNISDRFSEMTTEIDKLDKTGPDSLRKSMLDLGLSSESCEWLLKTIRESDLNFFDFNEIAQKAGQELRQVFAFNQAYTFHNELVFDPSLARGLSYYTGCIFEVKPTVAQMGSLGGGGRYDNLTAVFGLNGISGVGISFGADRIYDVMNESDLFPAEFSSSAKALFLSLDSESLIYAFEQATLLRIKGIAVDVYPEAVKLKKQFQHADGLKVPYVIIVGEEERKSGLLKIKNQHNGEQKELNINEISQILCQ